MEWRDQPTGTDDARRAQQERSEYVRHTAEHEITCQQFVELVTDYFEGALSARTTTQVEEHLVLCDWCVTYVEQMQTTIAALSDLGSEPAADEPPAGEPSAAVLGALHERRERSR
jgi:anti-sigma factor RsiW